MAASKLLQTLPDMGEGESCYVNQKQSEEQEVLSSCAILLVMKHFIYLCRTTKTIQGISSLPKISEDQWHVL